MSVMTGASPHFSPDRVDLVRNASQEPVGAASRRDSRRGCFRVLLTPLTIILVGDGAPTGPWFALADMPVLQ
jgi:hypothetical protein